MLPGCMIWVKTFFHLVNQDSSELSRQPGVDATIATAMTTRGFEYRFKIDVFHADTIPMARLAEYMAELAKLLGHPERVHFARLEEGSAVLVSSVEEPAWPKVSDRVRGVLHGDGPKDAMNAYQALDTMLAKDNAVGVLSASILNGEVIPFPGRTRPKPVRYGPFRERGTVDGVLIRIGGRDDTIPVLLRDGEAMIACQTSLELSKKLAPHYQGATLRAHGNGRWVREEDGSWHLLDFYIEDFEVLDDSPLREVVAHLRAVEGSTWGDNPNAMTDILNLRRDPKDQH
jgi:hypothetical protein